MRYDGGYGRGPGRGWAGAGPMGGMPRYDETFRGRPRGYDAGFRGYDRGYGSPRGAPWNTAFGHGANPSVNQQFAAGETDFLGRPYPQAAREDVPWGLIDQERMQARAMGYDAGYQPRGDGYVNRDPRPYGGRALRGYDRSSGYAANPRGALRGYDRDLRPEDYHPRFSPDSDEAGVDVHRYGRGRDMRYTSNWTRWF